MSAIRNAMILALLLSAPAFWGCGQGANGQNNLRSTAGDPSTDIADDDDFDDGDYEDGDFGDEEVCEEELAAADACWDALSDEADDADIDACIELDDAFFECIDENLPD